MPKKKLRTPASRTSAAPPRAEEPRRRGGFALGFAALLAGGTALRVLSARGELWLDEIWSFRLAHLLTNPAGVFSTLHHDNNHHLNSLYLYFVPESPQWILYRWHTLAAGVGTIILGAIIARREGSRLTALAATGLLGGSFLMVLYASEARGYALAVCFAFAAVVLAARFLETNRWWWGAAYALAAVLGILSHLTFLHALLGLIVWTTCRAVRQPRRANAWRVLWGLHALPLATLAALYWIDLRHLVLGGGPIIAPSEIVARALSLTVGGPVDGPWLGMAAAVAAVASGASIVLIRRSNSDLWILVVVTAIVGPVLTLLMVDSNLLYERYFLVAAAFITLSYGWLVAAAARRSRWLGLALALAFLATNAAHTRRLIDLGRGNYLPALRHMTRLATQHPVTIGSDHEFRNGRLVEFYQRFLPDAVAVEYHTAPEWAPAGPEWMLVHSQQRTFAPAPEITVAGGRRYRLSAFYEYVGVSGWHLAVYHNALAIPR